MSKQTAAIDPLTIIAATTAAAELAATIMAAIARHQRGEMTDEEFLAEWGRITVNNQQAQDLWERAQGRK